MVGGNDDPIKEGNSNEQFIGSVLYIVSLVVDFINFILLGKSVIVDVVFSD
jgi:hypothetical protein